MEINGSKKMRNTTGAVTGALLFFGLVLVYRNGVLADDKLQTLSSIIEVQNANTVQANEKPSWTYEDKLQEARKLLANTMPGVGSQEYTFSESRFLVSNGQIKTSRKQITEPELRIPLAVLEKATGKVSAVTITMKSGSIISPAGFPVEIEYRSNGIGWNWWNTQYRAPKGYAVLMNNYPVVEHQTIKKVVVDKRGRKKTVSERRPYLAGSFLYAPYSQGLHVPELVGAGRAYIRQMVSEAFTQLRSRGAKSQAFPGSLLADVNELRPEYFERLPIVEQSDMTEFSLNPQRTGERVFVLLAANKGQAFTQTKSSAGATGWMQFTPKTYSSMRKLYPEAQLIADFSVGAPNHLNSMMAAILLHDNNLKDLVRKFNPSIAQHNELEEYLAAAYNGAPIHMHRSLNAFFTLGLADWISSKYLKDETKGYMVKIRELKRIGLMSESSVIVPSI